MDINASETQCPARPKAGAKRKKGCSFDTQRRAREGRACRQETWQQQRTLRTIGTRKMSRRRSPSPGTLSDSSNEEDAGDCDAGAKELDAPRKKLWSWLHVAVSTGNLDKVYSRFRITTSTTLVAFWQAQLVSYSRNAGQRLH